MLIIHAALGDRLYVGTATGNIFIYKLANGAEGRFSSHAAFRLTYLSCVDSGGSLPAELLETRKNVSRRVIEQLQVIPDISSLIVLSGMTL